MSETTEFPLRILVQSDMVGAIIGRSGSTIKQITQQSKARIDVHRDDSLDQQEKVVTINGTAESCSTACFKILEVIINETMQSQNPSSSASNNFDDNEQTSANSENNNNDIRQEQCDKIQDTQVRLKILAHNNLIGRLIGRSGSSIKKIMEQTSTKINISGNSLTDCTQERTITVLGKFSQILQAEKVISSKLRAAYMSDINNQLQAFGQQPYLFNNVTLPYNLRPYAQNPILSSLVNSQSAHGGHVISRAMGQHQRQLPGKPLLPNSCSFFPMYPNLGMSPTLLGFSGTGSIDLEKETVHIYIPSNVVGALIGKSGSAIKEMIGTSGANIKVLSAPNMKTSLSSNASPNNATPSSTSNVDKEDNSLTENQNQRINIDSKTGTNSSVGHCHTKNIENGFRMQNSQTNSSEQTLHPNITSRHDSHNGACTDYSENQQHNTRKVTIVGTPEAQWSAQYLIYRKVAIENGKSDISLMVEIHVPSQSVGKIIGRAGAAVKNLQKQTRTIIRLPDDKQHPTDITNNNDNMNNELSETTVQITGEFQSTQLAQRHIRNLIKERL